MDSDIEKMMAEAKKRATTYYDMNGTEMEMMDWCNKYYDERLNSRHIGDDVIGDYRVSTVLLGRDHRFFMNRGATLPIIFETMIFAETDKLKGSDLDMYQERYCTKEEALQGHKEACQKAKEAQRHRNGSRSANTSQ